LDCHNSLEQKLKDQGFDVESGTTGHCTNSRRLPSQVYEKEIFIYNPTDFSFSEDGKTTDYTPQFKLEYMQSRIENGATFVAFLNQISDNIKVQRIVYGWIPFMPPIEPTHDKFVHVNQFDSFPDWDWKLLAPIVNKDEIDLPVLQKVSPPKPQEYRKDVFRLFENNHGECLGVLIRRGDGQLIVLPKFRSNEAVVESFLYYVLPRLYNTDTRIGLIDEFASPAERKSREALHELEIRSEEIKSRQESERKQVEKAKREKSTAINADATAKQILVYYDQAKRQDAAALFYLYKIIEAIENKYGGETDGIKAVGAGTEWKSVKRLANESYRDARHAPKPTDIIKQWSPVEIKKCFEDTQKVVMAYFATLFVPKD
jgi:hypothetical protein